VIFFELCRPFLTQMERVRVLTNLATNMHIQQQDVQNFPNEAALILKMVDHNPDNRPTTDDILRHALFSSHHFMAIDEPHFLPTSHSATSCLENELRGKDLLISQLQAQLAKLTVTTHTTQQGM